MSPTYTVSDQTARHLSPLADEQLVEACLIDAQPKALLWQPLQSLVVPRSYTRHATFNQACQAMQQQGWPVYVRQSGGGVVPQLSGIMNVSLCWVDYGRPLDLSNQAYEHLCSILQTVLARQHIESEAQEVQGSFCDGRYNLAIKDQIGSYVKVAGTAQHWRNARAAAWYTKGQRQAGDPADWHIVLAHALLFIDSDLVSGTRQTNRLEELLGTERRYDASKVISLATLGLKPDPFKNDIITELAQRHPPALHTPNTI